MRHKKPLAQVAFDKAVSSPYSITLLQTFDEIRKPDHHATAPYY